MSELSTDFHRKYPFHFLKRKNFKNTKQYDNQCTFSSTIKRIKDLQIDSTLNLHSQSIEIIPFFLMYASTKYARTIDSLCVRKKNLFYNS